MFGEVDWWEAYRRAKVLLHVDDQQCRPEVGVGHVEFRVPSPSHCVRLSCAELRCPTLTWLADAQNFKWDHKFEQIYAVSCIRRRDQGVLDKRLASQHKERRASGMWNGGAGSDKIDARTKGAGLALQHQTAVPDQALAGKDTAQLRLPFP